MKKNRNIIQTSGRGFLPIEDGVIVNQCGYIYCGSTNQMQYITTWEK